MSNILQKCIEIAVREHGQQKDIGGEFHILHSMRVMNNIKKDTFDLPYIDKCIAILHDVFEDTKYTYYDLVKELTECKFNNMDIALISNGVRELTKREGEKYQHYIYRVRDNYLKHIKLADIEDNSSPERLACLGKDNANRLIVKYTLSKMYLQDIITWDEYNRMMEARNVGSSV